ncbi:hypothetical protein OIU35_10910 [Boseaceae bacterium BT-24-1]|nr:hypothetical protein [Boseaceae bacterium BT-24-1]
MLAGSLRLVGHDLDGLFDACARAGLPIGRNDDPTRRARAAEFLHELAIAGLPVADAGQLARLLTPVIATAPEHAEILHRVIREHVASRDTRAVRGLTPKIVVQPPGGTERAPGTWLGLAWGLALTIMAALGALALLASLGWLGYLFFTGFATSGSGPVGPATVPPPRGQGENADWLRLLADIGWRSMVATPIALLGLYYLSRWQLRRPNPPSASDVTLSRGVPVAKSGFMTGARARAASEKLRRSITVPIRGVDVPRSIEASARAGGWPIAIPRRLRAELGTVVMLDVERPQQAFGYLAATLRLHFRAVGVRYQEYHFAGTPRWLRTPAGSRVSGLAELADHHVGEQLVLVGDGLRFTRPNGDLDAVLADCIERFERVIWLTPTPADSFGTAELAMARRGATVVTIGGHGLATLARALAGGEIPLPVPESLGRGVDGFLRSLVEMKRELLARDAPAADWIGRLVRGLRDYLGRDGWRVLGGLAVLRRFDAETTVGLGRALLERDVEPEDLGRLARLPWMAEGSMPAWLRSAILRDLSPHAANQVRNGVAQWLALAGRSDGYSQDEIRAGLDRDMTGPAYLVTRAGALPTGHDDPLFRLALAGAELPTPAEAAARSLTPLAASGRRDQRLERLAAIAICIATALAFVYAGTIAGGLDWLRRWVFASFNPGIEFGRFAALASIASNLLAFFSWLLICWSRPEAGWAERKLVSWTRIGFRRADELAPNQPRKLPWWSPWHYESSADGKGWSVVGGFSGNGGSLLPFVSPSLRFVLGQLLPIKGVTTADQFECQIGWPLHRLIGDSVSRGLASQAVDGRVEREIRGARDTLILRIRLRGGAYVPVPVSAGVSLGAVPLLFAWLAVAGAAMVEISDTPLSSEQGLIHLFLLSALCTLCWLHVCPSGAIDRQSGAPSTASSNPAGPPTSASRKSLQGAEPAAAPSSTMARIVRALLPTASLLLVAATVDVSIWVAIINQLGSAELSFLPWLKILLTGLLVFASLRALRSRPMRLDGTNRFAGSISGDLVFAVAVAGCMIIVAAFVTIVSKDLGEKSGIILFDALGISAALVITGSMQGSRAGIGLPPMAGLLASLILSAFAASAFAWYAPIAQPSLMSAANVERLRDSEIAFVWSALIVAVLIPVSLLHLVWPSGAPWRARLWATVPASGIIMVAAATAAIVVSTLAGFQSGLTALYAATGRTIEKLPEGAPLLAPNASPTPLVLSDNSPPAWLTALLDAVQVFAFGAILLIALYALWLVSPAVATWLARQGVPRPSPLSLWRSTLRRSFSLLRAFALGRLPETGAAALAWRPRLAALLDNPAWVTLALWLLALGLRWPPTLSGTSIAGHGVLALLVAYAAGLRYRDHAATSVALGLLPHAFAVELQATESVHFLIGNLFNALAIWAAYRLGTSGYGFSALQATRWRGAGVAVAVLTATLLAGQLENMLLEISQTLAASGAPGVRFNVTASSPLLPALIGWVIGLSASGFSAACLGAAGILAAHSLTSIGYPPTSMISDGGLILILIAILRVGRATATTPSSAWTQIAAALASALLLFLFILLPGIGVAEPDMPGSLARLVNGLGQILLPIHSQDMMAILAITLGFTVGLFTMRDQPLLLGAARTIVPLAVSLFIIYLLAPQVPRMALRVVGVAISLGHDEGENFLHPALFVVLGLLFMLGQWLSAIAGSERLGEGWRDWLGALSIETLTGRTRRLAREALEIDRVRTRSALLLLYLLPAYSRLLEETRRALAVHRREIVNLRAGLFRHAADPAAPQVERALSALETMIATWSIELGEPRPMPLPQIYKDAITEIENFVTATQLAAEPVTSARPLGRILPQLEELAERQEDEHVPLSSRAGYRRAELK